MDAFETVVASILQRQGYWTLTSVKVELTKAEKVKIGRHSSPRWELDIVAYRGKGNEVLVVECKSYLDSLGVERSAFDGTNKEAEKRYKLFRESTLRGVVLRRLNISLSLADSARPSRRFGFAWPPAKFEKMKSGSNLISRRRVGCYLAPNTYAPS